MTEASTSPHATAADAAVQRRVLGVLAVTQVLVGVGIATVLTVSTLVATRMSGSEAVGGVALTTVVLGAAAAALLLARVATRSGRRPALTLGYGAGTVGSAAAVAAVAAGSAAALIGALLLVGAATAAGLAARFAAIDLAEPARRSRALALVVWATTIGVVAGPNLAAPTQALAGWIGLTPATGPYLLSVLTFGLATAGAWWGLRPDPLLLARARAAGDGPPAPLVHNAQVRAALRASPMALLGLGGVVLGHLVMIGLMSMTPVHMDHGGAGLEMVGLVISVHVAGMYALSPVFGWLADLIGRVRVLVLAGLLLVAAAMVCSLAAPQATGLLSVGLFLLGLGWSASLIAGSTLLTESLPLEVRPGAQGLSDVTMNVCGAVAGIAAGLLVAGASYAALGIVAAVLVVPYLLTSAAYALRVPRMRPDRARVRRPAATEQ